MNKITKVKREIIKSPTLLQMTIGLIFSFFIKSQLISLPVKIGKYKLFYEIKKDTPIKNYAIGVYRLGKRKVFIKTWKGNLKNVNYYLLLNEYLINKILDKKLINNLKQDEKYTFRIPQVIDIIKSKNSLSIVFEYINGKTLTCFPVKEQAKILSKIFEKLENLSISLSEEEKKAFPKRTFLFYLISLPFLTFTNMLLNPRDSKVIFKAFIKFLTVLLNVNRTKLTLAHRDLKPHNVIINGIDVFIIDSGRMVLTISGYDITYLSIEDNLQSVVEITSKRLGTNINKFLENYILIQYCKWYGMPGKYVNIYMKNLYLKFG